jgi:hypothetical protein
MSGRVRGLAATALVVASVALLPACSFVQMAPGAAEVRVVGAGQLPAGCEKRGEVEVSVKDRLGPYERDDMRVRDELETLARNEAPSLAADTIQPKGPPADGAQRFLAFRCGADRSGPLPPRDADPAAGSEASTTPLRDD